MKRREFLASGALLAAGAGLAKPIRVGVFGHTGRGGYGHGLDTAFLSLINHDLVGVADPDDKGRAAAMKRLGTANGYASLAELLENGKPRFVTIGPRWVERKLEYLTTATEHGTHVYMEKPIAGSLEEADAIVTVAEKHGIKIVVAHQMRLCPQILHLKKLADAGTFGRLLEVRTRGKEDHRSGGEDLMVLGTHCLYLMRMFAGEASWCEAKVTQDDRDITLADKRAATEPLGPVAGDTIHATYGFANGVTGSFASQKGNKAPGGRFTVTLRFEKGVAHCGIDQDPKVQYVADPAWEPLEKEPHYLAEAPSNNANFLKATEACNHRIAFELLKIADEGGRSPVDIYEARSTLEMIFAVYAAHLAGGRVAFPLKDRKHPLGSL